MTESLQRARHPLDVLRTRTDLSNAGKGALFERLAPRALTYLLEVPESAIRKPVPDRGVDHVVKTSIGVVAVQEKCYDPRRGVSLSDVRMFVDEARSVHGADRLILMHTSYVSRNANSALVQHNIEVYGYDELVSLPISWGGEALPPPAPLTLLPHQAAALEAANSDVPRGKVLMATGTGKSLIEVTYAAQNSPSVLAVPSIELLRQHVPTIRRQYPDSRILAISSAKELHTAVAGMPVEFTTEPGHVADWLATHTSKVPEAPIIILVTYTSGPVLVEGATRAGVTFNAAVFDEAHRTAAVSASRKGLEKGRFNTLVTDLPTRRCRFFTATEKVHTQKLKDDLGERGLLAFSMDDPALYGPTLHELPYTTARESGLVAPFSFVVGNITDQEVRDFVSRNARTSAFVDGLDLDSSESIEDVAYAMFTLRAASDHGLRSLLSVHNSVRRATKAVSIYKAVATAMGIPLAAVSVHAKSSQDMRKRALDLLEHPPRNDGIAVVCNVRLFGEGVDVPRIDAVVYFESRSSAIDVVQTVGRATRTDSANPDKVALVVLPLFTGADTDVETAIEHSRFEKVYALGSALRDGGISIRQWVTIAPRSIGVTPRLPADAFVLQESSTTTFDARLLMENLQSVITTGSWTSFRDIAARVESIDTVTFVRTIKQMRESLLAAGLTEHEAKEQGLKRFNEMAKESGGNPAVMLEWMRADIEP